MAQSARIAKVPRQRQHAAEAGIAPIASAIPAPSAPDPVPAPPTRARQTLDRRRYNRGRGVKFEPIDVQRAYVAACAGVGVPHKIICENLPHPEPTKARKTLAIDHKTLEKHFVDELRDGMQLALARVAARVFHRALFGDEKSYQTHRAAEMILVTRGGWRKLGEGDPSNETPLGEEGLVDDMRQLSRAERAKILDILARAVS